MLFDFSKDYSPEEFAQFILHENHERPKNDHIAKLMCDAVEDDYIAELIRIDRKRNYDKGYYIAIQRSKRTDILADTLQLIIDIGFDHDGYKNAKDLGELIDELVSIARNGLKDAQKED
jgi:hypothetical protein